MAQHIVRSYDQELDALTTQLMEMGGLVESQISRAIDALVTRDAHKAELIVRDDEAIDGFEEEVNQLAIRLLATRQPVAVDLRVIAMGLKIANDLERMGDYATNIAKRTRRMSKAPEVRPIVTIPRMAETAQAMVKDVLDAFVARDAAKATAVWHRDDEVDAMHQSLFRELLTYMMEDPRSITGCTHLLFVAKNLERIADHATNIAEKVLYIVHGRAMTRAHAEQPEGTAAR